MYNVIGRPKWLPAVRFDSCKNLLSSVHTVSIILRSASLCIKRIYYYFYWPTYMYIGYVHKSMHTYRGVYPPPRPLAQISPPQFHRPSLFYEVRFHSMGKLQAPKVRSCDCRRQEAPCG